MSRLMFIFSVGVMFGLVASCKANERPWQTLPTNSSLSYQVDIVTFKEGGYADHPFKIRVSAKSNPGNRVHTVLSSSQCKNVRVIQKPDFLYFVYEEIVLHEFSNTQHDYGVPVPILCDAQHPFCRELLVDVRPSLPATQVCTTI
jgi:hypothetical protein